MKMPRLALLLPVVFILFSCQKEVENPEPGDQQTGETYIKQLVFLDTTRPSGQDTLVKRIFAYDASNRLLSTETFGYSSPPNAFGINLKSTSRQYYTGSNSFPDKITFENLQFDIPGNNYFDTLYLFYQNGIVKKDSVRYSIATTIINHFDQLSTTRSRIITRQLNSSGVIIDTSYTYTEWENGNLVREVDSQYFHLLPPGILVYETSCTYDNRPNPFRKMFIPYMYPASAAKAIGFPVEFELFSHPSENNIRTLAMDALGNSTVEYRYNEEGLPEFATVNESGLTYKACFIYTKL